MISIQYYYSSVIGAIAYWLFGYAFAFGSDSNGFIGQKYFALAELPADKFSNWFFHFVFAATSATIVSGAMAERTEFHSYLMYSSFLTGKSVTNACSGEVWGVGVGGGGGTVNLREHRLRKTRRKNKEVFGGGFLGARSKSIEGNMLQG